MTTKTEAAEANLDRLLEWISRVDTKAAFALLTGTAMLGTLVSFAPKDQELAMWLSALAYLTGFLLLLSLGCIMIVSFPRTRDPQVIAARPSLFYFGTVSTLKLDDYRSRFRALTEEDLLDDLIGQCHVNSRILDAKFRFLRKSHLFLYLAAVPWTVCLLTFLAPGGSA